MRCCRAVGIEEFFALVYNQENWETFADESHDVANRSKLNIEEMTLKGVASFIVVLRWTANGAIFPRLAAPVPAPFGLTHIRTALVAL